MEPPAKSPASFLEAIPVWPIELLAQMNSFVSFHAAAVVSSEQIVSIRIACASVYRLWVNGVLLGCGPARAAHGHARIDEWQLLPSDSRLEVVIEVSWYGVPTFYEGHGAAFLCAEMLCQGEVLAFTSIDYGKSGFCAENRSERARKIERYSYQRAFCEGYQIGLDGALWLSTGYRPREPLPLTEIASTPNWLPRTAPYPAFNVSYPKSVVLIGDSDFGGDSSSAPKRRFLHDVPSLTPGFDFDEIAWPLYETLLRNRTISNSSVESAIEDGVVLKASDWIRVEFESELTGFIGVDLKAETKTRLLIIFDEVLIDGEIVFDRLDTLNAIWIEIEAGTKFEFQSFEPYSFRFLKVLVVSGQITVRRIRCLNYENSTRIKDAPHSLSQDEHCVRSAAINSFRQNAVDIYTDCPSRERAGWLCDSFFMARAEWHLTGDNVIERVFLQNYLLPDVFADLPLGMVPMCYPAEVQNGEFIPNWALFLVLQLDEAQRLRNVPTEWSALIEHRVLRLLNYFEGFENEFGLIESLEGWIFVEWSRANDFVQEINFPTNMLYAASLRAASRLLACNRLLAKAERIEKYILDNAYRNDMFIDNAVRDKDGRIQMTDNSSEVCQYYAFFFSLISPESKNTLWNRLVAEEFTGLHPANSFIGKLLRLDLLVRHGKTSQARRELMNHYLPMADATATLWEHSDPRASCNHGFTSYVSVLIDALDQHR